MMDCGTQAPPGGLRRLPSLAKALLLGAALGSSAGCGTIATFSDGLKETDSYVSPKPFGGTRLDVRAVSLFSEQDFPWPLLAIAFVLDVPLSAAADVVTLPVTIPLHLSRPEEGPPVATPEDNTGGAPEPQPPTAPDPPASEADVRPAGGSAGAPA